MALSQNEDNNYYLIQWDAVKAKYLMVPIHSKMPHKQITWHYIEQLLAG